MTTAPDNPKRRWLQFRLKTLLLIVAMLCVPLAWVGVRMNQKRQERKVIAELERLDGWVQYDWQRIPVPVKGMPVLKPNATPTGPKWLRWLLGDDFFSHVVYVNQGAWRYYFSRKFAAPFLKDDDLRLVATFPKLEELDLSNTDIGDVGLAHLQGLTHLRSLALVSTNITDDGLRHLKTLKALKYLDLDGTKTTKAAVNDLAKALPECEIEWP